MLKRCECGTIIPDYAKFCDCCAYIEAQENEEDAIAEEGTHKVKESIAEQDIEDGDWRKYIFEEDYNE